MKMKVVLKNVRLSFPNLFVATVPKDYPTQKPAYSASFTFDKNDDNHKKLEEAVKTVAEDMFKAKSGKKLAEFRPNKMKFPIKDGDDSEKDYLKGKMTITAKRQASLGRPLVINSDKTPLTADDDKMYGGVWVNASVEIWAQDVPNDGIRCQLLAVQFSKHGERLGGSAPTDADFEEIEVSEDEELI